MAAADLEERELGLQRLLAPGAVAWTAIVTTAQASGGYFPPAWGWSAAALFLAAAAALVLSDRLELGRLEWVSLASLAAFVAFAGVSVIWSQSAPRSILEAQRGLVYVAALAAFLLLCSRQAARAVVVAIVAGAAGVAIGGLATKLFPDHFKQDLTFPTYGLSRPLGYWNAVGLVAVVATLLAIGLAVAAPNRTVRAISAAVVPILVATLYLTFSRGSWLVLGLGLVILVALHPARHRAALTIAALAPAAAVGVFLESRSPGLTRVGAHLDEQTRAGHRVAAALVLLAILAAGAPSIVGRVPPLRFPRGAKRALAVVLAAGGVAFAVVAIRNTDFLIGQAYDAFRSSSTPTTSDLNQRLFTASGNERAAYWRVAWHDVHRHPLAGSGAGTFELRWYRDRPNAFGVRDAHNLYLETLAELGPIGLMLLLIALGTPLLALRSRRDEVTAAAAAAYCAYLAHAAIDWDWELPTLTVAALACATVCLVGARREHAAPPVRPSVRLGAAAAAVILAAVAGAGFVQARSLQRAYDALHIHALHAAADNARDASRLAPWQADPWTVLGEAQLAQGQRLEARASFRHAVANDPGDWFPWYQLALSSPGSERREALRKALSRNPRAPELIAVRRELTRSPKSS